MRTAPRYRNRSFENVLALIRMAILILGVYWLAIFVATHLPGSSLPSLGSDKVYHLLAFCGLSWLLSWVVALRVPGVRRQAIIVMVVTALYALFDEWSQQFVVGRQCDLADAVADCCGSALGILAYQLTRPILLKVPRLATSKS